MHLFWLFSSWAPSWEVWFDVEAAEHPVGNCSTEGRRPGVGKCLWKMWSFNWRKMQRERFRFSRFLMIWHIFFVPLAPMKYQSIFEYPRTVNTGAFSDFVWFSSIASFHKRVVWVWESLSAFIGNYIASFVLCLGVRTTSLRDVPLYRYAVLCQNVLMKSVFL